MKMELAIEPVNIKAINGVVEESDRRVNKLKLIHDDLEKKSMTIV